MIAMLESRVQEAAHARAQSSKSPLRVGRSALVMLVATILVASVNAPGCSGPQVSGLAFGDTRFVSVNEVVELQIPLNDAGRTAWRVADYDSVYLALINRPRVEQRGGTSVMIILTRARTVGQTTLVIESVPTAEEQRRGVTPQRRSFKINIGEQPFNEVDRESAPKPASAIPDPKPQ